MSKNFADYDNLEDVIGAVGTELGKRPKTFNGTQEEWNNLTLEEKIDNDVANIKDDSASGEVAQEVAESDGRPVSSDGVYNALEPLRQNTDGYFVLPNGLKICWGTVDITSSGQGGASTIQPYYGYANVTFPITFTNVPCVWGCQPTSSPNFWFVGAYSATTKTCVITLTGDRNATMPCRWMALGY